MVIESRQVIAISKPHDDVGRTNNAFQIRHTNRTLPGSHLVIRNIFRIDEFIC